MGDFVGALYLLSLQQRWQHVWRIVINIVQVAGDACQGRSYGSRRQQALPGAVQERYYDKDGYKVVEHLDRQPPSYQVALLRRRRRTNTIVHVVG